MACVGEVCSSFKSYSVLVSIGIAGCNALHIHLASGGSSVYFDK